MAKPQDFRVLIIEDNDDSRLILNEYLKSMHLITKEARDGMNGLLAIKKWNPSLILLDIMMPRLDGFMVLEKMKDEGFAIPVIMTTAINDKESVSRATRLGAVDYLVKPYDLLIVKDKIERVLNIPLSSDFQPDPTFTFDIEKENDILYIRLEGSVIAPQLDIMKEQFIQSMNNLKFDGTPKFLIDIRDVDAETFTQNHLKKIFDMLLSVPFADYGNKVRFIVNDPTLEKMIQTDEIGRYLGIAKNKFEAKKTLR